MVYRLASVIGGLILAAFAGFYLGSYKSVDDRSEEPNIPVLDNSPLDTDQPKQVASSDVLASVSDILTLPPGFQQYRAGYSFAQGLNEEQLQTAINEALEIEPAYLAHELTSIFISRYVDLTRDGALEFLISQLTLGSQEHTELLTTLYREIALTDAEYAWRVVDRMTTTDQTAIKAYLLGYGVINAPELKAELSKSERNALVRSRLAQLPPEQAYFRTGEIEGTSERAYAISRIIYRWFQKDPEKAFRAIALAGSGFRTSLYPRILRDWAAKDFEAALAAATSLEDPRLEYLSVVIGQLAQSDPSTALEVARQYQDRDADNRLLSSVMRNWASKDLQAAADYVMSLDDDDRAAMASGIAWVYLNTDSEKAMDWIQQSGINHRSLSTVFNDYVRIDANAAQRRLETMPASAMRDKFVSSFIGMIVADPEEKLDWIQQFEDAENYRRMHENVLNRWIHEDLISATDYVMSQRDSADKQSGIMQLLSPWAREDLEQAETMLEVLGSDELKDRGLAIIAGSVTAKDWEQAMSYVNRIADENDQRNARASVIRQIGRSDRRHAQQLLSDYDLTNHPYATRLRD